MLPKLQYISQGATVGEQLDNIRAVLEAGCRWVQLRFKQAPEPELLRLAEKVRVLCANSGALFIVNDHPAVARAVSADGVHLGLDDMPVAAARLLLPAHSIIGGTANTLQHLRQRLAEGCSYAGMGPFRFTPTKEKLSPVLGAEGYRTALQALSAEGQLPVYAIGGIRPRDLPALLEAGVYGVALSAALTAQPQLQHIIHSLNQQLYATTDHRRQAV